MLNTSKTSTKSTTSTTNAYKKRKTIHIEYDDIAGTQDNPNTNGHTNGHTNPNHGKRKRITKVISLSSSSCSSVSPSLGSPRRRRGYNSGVSQISRIDGGSMYEDSSPPSSVVEGGRDGLYPANQHEQQHEQLEHRGGIVLDKGVNLDALPQHVSMMCVEMFAMNGRNNALAPIVHKDPIEMICYVIERDDGNANTVPVPPASFFTGNPEPSSSSSSSAGSTGGTPRSWTNHQSPIFSQQFFSQRSSSQHSSSQHSSSQDAFSQDAFSQDAFSQDAFSQDASPVPPTSANNQQQYGSQLIGMIVVDIPPPSTNTDADAAAAHASAQRCWRALAQKGNVHVDVCASEEDLLM